ncbi:MAG TPA: hypothetical protein VMJ65_14215 [Solirubrobacteraceae bacterium]|nr:hypothetical protein [Solirubrobacteraceae bacterium]
MASLPRPLIGLLVATLAAFGLWYVELKPSSSSSGGSSQGVGSYQSAINKAHQAVKISGAANAKIGAPTSTGPAPNSPTTTNATTGTRTTVAKATTTPAAKTAAPAKSAADARTAKPAAKTAKPGAKTQTTAQQVRLVENAIRSHKVVAVLFYNAAAADDQAMHHELATVPTHGGKVVKLAVPVSELTSFGVITQQVPVVTAPTLVMIDAARQATTITGFADPLEISQRVDDALAAK